MHHDLRAILDRFIYEHAGVRHLLLAAPPEADTRTLEGIGWTTVQAVGHFAQSQESYADLLQRWLDGGTTPAAGFHPDQSNAETIPALANSSRADVLERYALSLRSLFAVLHRITDQQFEGPFGGTTVRQALVAWSEHQVSHIFPFVAVLPETRYDPVIVNWLARTPVPNEETLAGQRAYIADVREYYARLAAEEGDDADD